MTVAGHDPSGDRVLSPPVGSGRPARDSILSWGWYHETPARHPTGPSTGGVDPGLRGPHTSGRVPPVWHYRLCSTASSKKQIARANCSDWALRSHLPEDSTRRKFPRRALRDGTGGRQVHGRSPPAVAHSTSGCHGGGTRDMSRRAPAPRSARQLSTRLGVEEPGIEQERDTEHRPDPALCVYPFSGVSRITFYW